jgi:disulfide bond formation protein DsbB
MTPQRAGLMARKLALATPLVLLAGAYISEYGFGLFPCEMCWWQRYAHFAALPLALAAWLKPSLWWATVLAALAIAVSAGIGLFHAGVEYHWWQGLTRCSTDLFTDGNDPLDAIMNAPTVRCDAAQWSFLGISLAGWNFLISGAAAILACYLMLQSRKGRA